MCVKVPLSAVRSVAAGSAVQGSQSSGATMADTGDVLVTNATGARWRVHGDGADADEGRVDVGTVVSVSDSVTTKRDT